MYILSLSIYMLICLRNTIQKYVLYVFVILSSERTEETCVNKLYVFLPHVETVEPEKAVG